MVLSLTRTFTASKLVHSLFEANEAPRATTMPDSNLVMYLVYPLYLAYLDGKRVPHCQADPNSAAGNFSQKLFLAFG